MNLTRTINSACKPSVTYGTQGEAVEIISQHGSVIIIEGVKGRFSVVQQDLTTEAVEMPIESIEVIETKIKAVAPGKKKHQLQTQLF
jgi:hypothetical protein